MTNHALFGVLIIEIPILFEIFAISEQSSGAPIGIPVPQIIFVTCAWIDKGMFEYAVALFEHFQCVAADKTFYNFEIIVHNSFSVGRKLPTETSV